MKIIGILAALLLFVLLIAVHEAGHMLAAKLCGVRVNEFAIGMGPLIYKKKKGETQYSVRAVPIGGFCRLEGEDELSQDPRAFNNAAWWKKIIILAAGAFNNIVLCIVVVFLVYFYAGSLTTTLASVSPGGAAELAGIRAGDTIIAVDDKPCSSWVEIVSAISGSENESIKVSYIPAGASAEDSVSVELVPEYNEEAGRRVIGISSKLVHSFRDAAAGAVETPAMYFGELRAFFGRLFTGRAEMNEVSGVVGMISILSEEAERGVLNVIFVLAIFSLNLGVVNLLPFPALDGCRILFVIIRALSGGRIKAETERRIHMAGIVVLLSLMVFLIFKDAIFLFKN